MWPDWVSNPGPLTYESGALPTALRGPASFMSHWVQLKQDVSNDNYCFIFCHGECQDFSFSFHQTCHDFFFKLDRIFLFPKLVLPIILRIIKTFFLKHIIKFFSKLTFIFKYVLI